MLLAQVLAAPFPTAPVCAKAPPGMGFFQVEFTGWAMWTAIGLIGGIFFLAVGLLVWGRLTGHQRGSNTGMGLLLVVFGSAILYVVGPGILDFILSRGGC